jgi:hypothetical protein
MARNRKIALWTAGVIAALLVLLIASPLLIPLFVDQQEIRERLQRTLADTMEGTIDFERMDVSLLPPRGRLTNISVAIPGREVVGVAESATAYLKILPLFTGRVEVGSVEVRRPDFRIQIPEIKAGAEKQGAEAWSPEEFAGAAYGALSRLQTMRPDLEILVEDGRLRLTREGEPVLVLHDVDASIDLPPDGLDIEFRSASNLWESLTVGARINGRLEGKGSIEVRQLQPHLAADVLFAESGLGIGDSLVNAKTRFRMNGTLHMEGEVEASAPRLTILRGSSSALLKVDTLRGQYHLTDQRVRLLLTELEMGYPAMKLSGSLDMDRTAPITSVELHAEGVNVKAVRDLSLSMAGDIPAVKKGLETARGGTIVQAAIASRGESWEDLLEPMNMDIQAQVSDMQVQLPELELELEGVTGRLSLEDGLFKGEDLVATAGEIVASDGSVAIGIQGENPPFRLDTKIRADLAQTVSILTRVIEDRELLKAMNRVKRVDGSAQGRLVLGDRLESMEARVQVGRMSLSGEYEGLPFPVEISQGRFTYEGERVSWQDVVARMGQTQVTRVNGAVDLGEREHLEVAVDQAVLNLGELHPWLTSLGEVPDALNRIGSVEGQVLLSAFQLKGPVTEPGEWVYQGKGRIVELLVEAPQVPGALGIAKAGFSVDPEMLTFEQARVSVEDTDLVLSGTVEAYREPTRRLNLSLQGTVGPAVKEWISSAMQVPPEYRVRAPLSFSQATLVWAGEQEFSFQGLVTVAGGPQVTLDVVREEQGDILVRNLVIDGADGRAAMSMNLGREVIDLKFQGSLSETTMARIMEEGAGLKGWIRGDFSGRILMDTPAQSRLNGTLEAGDLSVPGPSGSPVLVNRVSLKALGEEAQVETAELAWRGLEAAVRGKVGLDPEGVLVDLTVESDGFTWETVTGITDLEENGADQEKGAGPGAGKNGLLGAVPVHGKIHVEADYFRYGEWSWEPFVFDLNLTGRRLVVEIVRGSLCGIPTEATVKVSPEPMELEAETEVSDRELRKTLSCFLDTRLATGQFDFEGEVVASGRSENLLRNLQGRFTIDAAEGRIYRFGLLAKILGVVNITEILKGRGPDLAGEGLGYKSARFVGNIKNGRIELEEGYIDADSMGLAFKGGIDLPTEEIDLTVLVTPLKTVDTILEKIPLIGGILGDNFLAIPVRVRGDVSDPSVTPLPPSAVGAGLLGILERTLKLPGKVIQPFMPGKKG